MNLHIVFDRIQGHLCVCIFDHVLCGQGPVIAGAILTYLKVASLQGLVWCNCILASGPLLQASF